MEFNELSLVVCGVVIHDVLVFNQVWSQGRRCINLQERSTENMTYKVQRIVCTC